MVEIQIKYHDGAQELEKIEKGDWIDLRANENVDFEPMDYKLISLGVSMKLPDGYEAHVVPRSSTFKNFKLIQTNSMGIIDNTYSGNDDIWKMPVLAVEKTSVKKGDRICQFRIVKTMQSENDGIQLTKVYDLGLVNRDGFGTTGIK